LDRVAIRLRESLAHKPEGRSLQPHQPLQSFIMNSLVRPCLTLAVSPLLVLFVRAAEPTAEELLKPTRLTLITSGSDLAPVLADIEQQTGNKLVDETGRFSDTEKLAPWNFSLYDREFWPLLDKFLDAADLEPLNNSGGDGLPIGRRPLGMTPRFGQAIYVGPFRLEVTKVASHIGTRFQGDHRASVELEVAWEPRLRPLMFTQTVNELKMVADDKTPVTVADGSGELSVETTRDNHAVELHLPLQLPPQPLETISSLKGRIKALVATRMAKFRFDQLDKAQNDKNQNVEQSDGGVKVVLDRVRENQGLCELHMRVEFAENLPEHVAQGSWNFQNLTYLENAAGEKLEHEGFESTMQAKRKLGLAYYFDVPAEKLADYTWVYEIPAAIVEVPIEFELKEIPLP